MRQLICNLFAVGLLVTCVAWLATPAQADMTPFRSAGTVTTDGSPAYTNLNNCSVTDGQTCDRALGPLYGNLVFQNFGNYGDFGMPEGSKITGLRVRVTGRTNAGLYVGLSASGVTCQSPSDLLVLGYLNGSTITSQTLVAPVTDLWQPLSVNSFCLQPYQLDTNRLSFRINYSSAQYWFANIDNFEIAFVYTPPSAPEKTPLIIIPGIAGSELQTNQIIPWAQPDGHGGVFYHIYPKGENIWVNKAEAAYPGSDDYFDVLRMKSDGSSQADVGITGNLFDGGYGGEVNFFLSHGYELDKTLFIFPYDWRKDVSITTPLLDQKIQEIKQATGVQQVDIVAHSMGGLVARRYISDPQRASNVKRLFTLGTPHLGAVDSIKKLMYGDCITSIPLNFCLGISSSEVKDVMQNMISAYELTPSKAYYTFYSGDNIHPYPFFDQRDVDKNGVTGALTYSEIKTLLTSLGNNTSLYQPSEELHSLDDSLSTTNGVTIVNIIGSGIPTLGQIIESSIFNFAGVVVPKKDEIMINGDETVPLFSASLTDPARNISLLGNASVYYTNQKHGGLVTSGPALDLVNNILQGNSSLPAGVAKTPYSFSGTSVSVHSPVDLHIYDSNGNHTGLTESGYEENIPGSSYSTLDDAKFIFLPDNGVYRIVFDSTGEGSFDVKIRDFENSENTKTTLYSEIPLTSQTKGEAVLDTSSQEAPIIRLDANSDGVIDQEIPATRQVVGTENSDYTPPQTTSTLQGNKGDNGWYVGEVTVTLNATDDSAVDTIYYTLDQGKTVRTYQGPFALSADGVYNLQFRSVDEAGNEEAPHIEVIKVDTSHPEAKIFIDQTIQDLMVQGVDANPTTVTKFANAVTNKVDDGLYVIKDVAGNQLAVDIRNREREKKDAFSVYSLQYNTNQPLVLGPNSYTVSYQGEKAALTVKEQKFQVRDIAKITIQYDSKKDQSTILRNEGSTTTKETRPGLSTLQLLTANGTMSYGY